jgi:hypothetical protein
VCKCLYRQKHIKLCVPLWSSDQSSWLQIQRSRVRFPVQRDFLRSSGSEQGPLRLVSTIELLLGRYGSGSRLESQEYGHGDSLRWQRDTPYSQNLALASPTSSGLSSQCFAPLITHIQVTFESLFFDTVTVYSKWNCILFTYCIIIYQYFISNIHLSFHSKCLFLLY